jgi:hypothetical protein
MVISMEYGKRGQQLDERRDMLVKLTDHAPSDRLPKKQTTRAKRQYSPDPGQKVLDKTVGADLDT